MPLTLPASTNQGIYFINYLNSIYGASQGNPSKTYDWCGDVDDGGINIGLMIGVAGGVVVLIIIATFGIRQYRKRVVAKNTEGVSRKPLFR